MSFSIKSLPFKGNCGFRQEGYHVWCSSVIFCEEDNLYHMFASRWSNKIPFHPGWLVASEVLRATSKELLGPYTFAEVVLPARGAEYWDGRMTHNPRIVKSGGKYVLFYTGTTYPFELKDGGANLTNADPETVVSRSNKRIGIAVSDSIYGPWQRKDAPVLDVKPNSYYSFLTSNPSPIVEEDGSIYLMFKSRKYNQTVHSEMFLGVARADSYDAPFEVITQEPLKLSEIEDPFVWKSSDGRYCMIAKDMTGRIAGTPCDGIFADSDDGVNWRSHGCAYGRTLYDESGNEHKFALLERPFLYNAGDEFTAFFAAVSAEYPYVPKPTVATYSCAWAIEPFKK